MPAVCGQAGEKKQQLIGWAGPLVSTSHTHQYPTAAADRRHAQPASARTVCSVSRECRIVSRCRCRSLRICTPSSCRPTQRAQGWEDVSHSRRESKMQASGGSLLPRSSPCCLLPAAAGAPAVRCLLRAAGSPQPPPLAHALECAVGRRHVGVRLLRLLPRVLNLLPLPLQVCQNARGDCLPSSGGRGGRVTGRRGGAAAGAAGCGCWCCRLARPAHCCTAVSPTHQGPQGHIPHKPGHLNTASCPLTSVSCSCCWPCCMRSLVLPSRSVAFSRRSRCPALVW